MGTTISDIAKHRFQNKTVYSNSFQELLPHCNPSLCCELLFPRKRRQKINLFIQIWGKCPRKLIFAPVDLFSCKKFCGALHSWGFVHLQRVKRKQLSNGAALPLPRKSISEQAEQQIFHSFPHPAIAHIWTPPTVKNDSRFSSQPEKNSIKNINMKVCESWWAWS